MKSLYFSLILFVLLFSCKNEYGSENDHLTDAQKIAEAHGIEHWDKVNQFEFRFGGKKDDSTSGRLWMWRPKTNEIRLIRNGDTVFYNRTEMDTMAIAADKAFINDKFWALIPFQLVWDESASITEKVSAKSPVKQEDLFKITITYPDVGGYTPGDAYDIYYDDGHIIKEWTYRRANSPEPTLSNTFENYQDFSGLKIALEHKRTKDDWNLLIRNVKVIFED